MNVVARQIIVLKNDVRLLTVAQPVHILASDTFQLLVRQFIVGMRIKRNMDDWAFATRVLRH